LYKDSEMQLAIIMSTYNGGKYLTTQLDSILKQSLPSDLILIRDDGSTDDTVHRLNEYKNKYEQIHILQDNLGNIGVQRSYALLLRHVFSLNVQYVMFADQDDVWLPEKTQKLMAAISRLDNKKPALVFSDVQVVDSNLQLISPSLLHFQKLNPHHASSLKALLLYSPALGCSMLFNAQLLKFLLSLSEGFPNPDKWALLVAAALGQVDYLAEPTLLYRQHSENVTGALKGIHRKVLSFQSIQFIKKRYQTAINEARILERHVPNLYEKDKIIIQQFTQLFTGNYWSRFVNYFRFSRVPPYWNRKVGLFLSLFFRYQ